MLIVEFLSFIQKYVVIFCRKFFYAPISIVHNEDVDGDSMKLEELAINKWIDSLPQKLDGRLVFKEGFTILPVYVTSITRNSEHLFLDITPCAMVGLQYHRTFKISDKIEALRKQPELYWYAPYVGWSLYLDPNVVLEAARILSQIPDGKSYLDDMIIEETHSEGKLSTRRRSGPVRERIFAFLDDAANKATLGRTVEPS